MRVMRYRKKTQSHCKNGIGMLGLVVIFSCFGFLEWARNACQESRAIVWVREQFRGYLYEPWVELELECDSSGRRCFRSLQTLTLQDSSFCCYTHFIRSFPYIEFSWVFPFWVFHVPSPVATFCCCVGGYLARGWAGLKLFALLSDSGFEILASVPIENGSLRLP